MGFPATKVAPCQVMDQDLMRCLRRERIGRRDIDGLKRGARKMVIRSSCRATGHYRNEGR